VHLVPYVPGELLAGLRGDADTRRPGLFQQVRQPGVAAAFALAGNRDVVDVPGTGAQRLLDRVQTVENLHPSSVRKSRLVSNPTKNPFLQLVPEGILRTLGTCFSSAHRDFSGRIRVIVNVKSPAILTAEAVRQIERENAAIARGLKRQDPELLDQLIETYQHRLMRYLMFLTNKREVAEDLFQEVWIRVLRRGSQYNGKARFDTWIFTIARNLVIDLSRKRTMASLDEMREAGEDERPFEIAQDGPSPLEQFQGREDAAELAKVMLTLEPSYREVLTLRFHEELSLEEIAAVTRAPLSTVKSRLYRGLASLKPRLQQLRGQRNNEDGHHHRSEVRK
jgi:RNA polymerase sigma-70 factor (ECF subfamily)